jgi:hypothetical protein
MYYRLNLDRQINGDFEVHSSECRYYPTSNYEPLGSHKNCHEAVNEAKRKHPDKSSAIEGCIHCSRECHK